MTEVLCQVCNEQPKKYKCPTCSAPYCSLACFKLHKPIHDNTDTPTTANISNPVPSAAPEVPQPPPPKPVPRYLKQKVDFSIIASNPKFRELLKSHSSLLSSLQRVYAATIEPDPDDRDERNTGAYRGFRGRARGRGYIRGDMGRGRGRGRGGQFGGPGSDQRPRWNPKKGDAEAMRMLKRFRDGKQSNEEKEAMQEFVDFVGETLESGKASGGPNVQAG